MNGGWLGNGMKSSYVRIERCASTDCQHARMYDRRDNLTTRRDAWVYDLILSDQRMRDNAQTEHIRINVRRDEFTEAKAKELAEEAGRSIGRMPYALRWNLVSVHINDGPNAWGGSGSGWVLIHDGSTKWYREWGRGNIYDETMVHESGHVSMDIMVHEGMCEEYE